MAKKHSGIKQAESKTPEKKDKCCCKWNIWKIVAVVVVLVFALILAGGLLKLHKFKAEFTSATDAQIETARSLVTTDLQGRGLNATEYNITIPEKIRKMDKRMDRTGVQRTLLPANARSGTSKHDYIIDMDAGMIVMHSQTEAYGWMAEQIGKEGECGRMKEKETHGECGKIREMPGPTRGWLGGWIGGWLSGPKEHR